MNKSSRLEGNVRLITVHTVTIAIKITRSVTIISTVNFNGESLKQLLVIVSVLGTQVIFIGQYCHRN